MNSTTKCRFLFPFHEVHFFYAFNISVKQLFGKKNLIFLTAPWMVNAVTKIGFSKKRCWIYVDPHVGASVPRRRWSCCTCSMWRCSSRSRSWKRGWPRRGKRAWAPSRRCRKHFYTQAFVRYNVNKWLQCYFNLVTYLRILCKYTTHVRARWKNLTFPNYDFGKGQYAFYPIKFSRFDKNKFLWNTKLS